jgi:RNA polymerase sigma-70 factor, ECF subfamily
VPTRQDPTADWDWTVLLGQCLREAQRVLGQTAEAEDAAQEAAVRAWQKRHACASADRPGAWVRTIAQREALRFAGRRRELPLDELVEPGQCDEDRRLLQRSVRDALAALSADERRLLLGSYWYDLPAAELGRLLGRGEATVRVQLHRIRARLRDTLDPTLSSIL